MDDFILLGKGCEKAYMGETLTTPNFPVIKFRVSYHAEKQISMTLYLIRGGTLTHTFKGEISMEIEYVDGKATPGEKTHYRLMASKKHLTSNPIFVIYNPSSP